MTNFCTSSYICVSGKMIWPWFLSFCVCTASQWYPYLRSGYGLRIWLCPSPMNVSPRTLGCWLVQHLGNIMGAVLPYGAGINAEVERDLLALHVLSACSVTGPLMN